MPQSPTASSEAIERLKRDIARDRTRVSNAMRLTQATDESDSTTVGRLYQVFVAMGQAS